MNRFEHGGDVWHGNPSDWLDFSSNNNALGCPDFIQQALGKAMDEVSFYPQVTMQRAIGGLSQMLGVPEAYILPANGGIGALDLIITKLNPKRVVAVTPSFVEYERIAVQHGIAFVSISMLKDRHIVAFPYARLSETIQSGDMLIVCNPSNPTGFGVGHDTMKQLLELAEKRQATLLVDEAFSLFSDGLSMCHWVQDHPGLLIAGSLTKIFAIPGVRIGYILGQSDVIDVLKAYQTPWVLSAFASSAAAAAGGSHAFIRQTAEKTVDARCKLKLSLESLGLFVYDSCANYLLVDLKPAGVTTASLADQLRTRHILVRSCENYRGLDAYHMRIAVKNDEDNKRLIRELTIILKGKK